MQHVVMYSGGVASYMAAHRVVEKHGPQEVTLLFADTLIEDEDLYRFLKEGAAKLKVPITWLVEGRDPWQVYKDVRMIGNSRLDPCSRILKREPMRRWLEENCDPQNTVVYLGFDALEINRFERALPYWEPWTVEAPLNETPILSKDQILEAVKAQGLKPPRLYELGFAHNNCGGFCCKAGHGQFKQLLKHMPERYKEHEQQEEEMRQYLGKNVAMLKDRRGGTTKPLPLADLRERVEEGEQISVEDDFAGCACMEPAPDSPDA